MAVAWEEYAFPIASCDSLNHTLHPFIVIHIDSKKVKSGHLSLPVAAILADIKSHRIVSNQIKSNQITFIKYYVGYR